MLSIHASRLARRGLTRVPGAGFPARAVQRTAAVPRRQLRVSRIALCKKEGTDDKNDEANSVVQDSASASADMPSVAPEVKPETVAPARPEPISPEEYRAMVAKSGGRVVKRRYTKDRLSTYDTRPREGGILHSELSLQRVDEQRRQERGQDEGSDSQTAGWSKLELWMIAFATIAGLASVATIYDDIVALVTGEPPATATERIEGPRESSPARQARVDAEKTAVREAWQAAKERAGTKAA